MKVEKGKANIEKKIANLEGKKTKGYRLQLEIRPFFSNRRDSFSILARILSFPGTLPDSTIFRYSH